MLAAVRRAHRFFRFSAEVEKALALAAQDPLAANVVLLESAILTHGMPFPQNMAMANNVEDIIRKRGAVPATVAVLNGRIHVGLGQDELEEICSPSADGSMCKISRRDFPLALSRQLSGGTTVAGTLVVASMLGPAAVFVTGGIGGVHRGGQDTMDVSADIIELGRSSTAVISAGIKSILDIGRTLEQLETQGVCVATFGPDKEFPAFFSRRSGFQSPYCVQTVREAASLIASTRDFQLNSGILIGVPIPDHLAAEGAEIESAIQSALKEVCDQGVAGRDVTPFVLSKVNRLTEGKSLSANLGLIENNADVGARIAVELARLRYRGSGDTHFVPGLSEEKRPFVIGGSIFDLVTRINEESVMGNNGETLKGHVHFGFGGVARNLADALARFDLNPIFASVIGNDEVGKNILAHNGKLSKDDVLVCDDVRSAVYNVYLDHKGQAKFGVGDMTAHQRISAEFIDSKRDKIEACRLLLVDGNLPTESVHHLLRLCSACDVPVFFEPTDVRKARKAVDSKHFSAVTYTSPNQHELASMVTGSFNGLELKEGQSLVHGCVDLGLDLLRQVQVVVVTLGDQGVLVVRRGATSEPLPLKNDSAVYPDTSAFVVSAKYYPVQVIHDVVSVSGAGDCFAAAFVASLLSPEAEGCQDRAVACGFQAAALSLRDSRSVPYSMKRSSIDWTRKASGSIVL